MLELRDVRAGYGDAVVLDGISLEVPKNGSLAVLGRNGVGKSTLLLTILGYTRVQRGTIIWEGADISALPPHRRARLGIGWVAQEREIFPSLSVEENLCVASRPGRWDLARVYALFPRLRERRANMGNQLSGGEQQMLAIARALMSSPKLLLVDEPSVGLAPILVSHTITKIKELKEKYGLTVLMAEQNFHQAIRIADRGYIIVHGEIVFEGGVQALEQNELVKSYYLGT